MTVHEPGSTSVKPASRTEGNPLASSSVHCPGSAVRTARSNPDPFHSERIVAPAPSQAICAAWPAWAIAFPADMGSRGLR